MPRRPIKLKQIPKQTKTGVANKSEIDIITKS